MSISLHPGGPRSAFCRGRLLPATTALGLFALGLGSWLDSGCSCRRDQAKSPDAGSVSTLSGEQPSCDRPRHRFAADLALIYQVAVRSSSTSDPKAALGPAADGGTTSHPAQSYQVSFHGEMVLRLIEEAVDALLLAVHFRRTALQIAVDGTESPADAARFERDLREKAYFRISPQGEVKSIQFMPRVGSVSSALTRMLLGALQLVFPKEPEQARGEWEAVEHDAHGRFVARYRASPAGEGAGDAGLRRAACAYTKTKMRYFPRETRAKQATRRQADVTTAPDSRAVIVFDAERGVVTSVEGREQQVTAIAGKTVGRGEASFRLTFAETTPVSAAELSQLRRTFAERRGRTPDLPLSEDAADQTLEEAMQRKELGGDTLESLLALMDRLDRAKDDDERLNRLYLKLKALIYLEPAAAVKLGSHVASAPTESLRMRVLSGALSAVGNEGAQQALMSAIRARAEDQLALQRLLPALAGTTDPVPAAEELVRGFAERAASPEVRSLAILAMGTLAHQLLESAPARANGIVSWLARRLEVARETEATQLLLLALGNVGSEAAFPRVERFLSDPLPYLRIAAAGALVQLPGTIADGWLHKLAKSDPDPLVRVEAVSGIGSRDPTPDNLRLQQSLLLEDRDPRVRLAVLRNFAGLLEKNPELKGLLREVARRDASKDVRQAAREILGGHR